MNTKPNRNDNLLSYEISDTVCTCCSSRPSHIDEKHKTCGIVVRHCLKVYMGLKGEGRYFIVSLRWESVCQCDVQFSLAVGTHVSTKNSACWIVIRFETLSVMT